MGVNVSSEISDKGGRYGVVVQGNAEGCGATCTHNENPVLNKSTYGIMEYGHEGGNVFMIVY